MARRDYSLPNPFDNIQVDKSWLKETIQPSMDRKDAMKILRNKCWAHMDVAVATLVDVCMDRRADPKARVAAAVSLMDRGFGKPEQLNVIQPQFEGNAGVLMLPANAPDGDEWTKNSQAHHSKMLN